MIRSMALVASLACVVACDSKSPSAPAPPPVPTGPNQKPQVVATFSPDTGVDELTTYTATIRVTDPDGDPVALTYRRCNVVPNETPLELNNGVATLSFKADWRCGTSLSLTGVDARGGSTQIYASTQHLGLNGSWRLVVGEGAYAQPYFFLGLTQSGAALTGTIRDDHNHEGGIDGADPGQIEENGQFRLRFKIQSEPDLVVSGRVIAESGDLFSSNLIATGQVVGGRYAGRGFQIWSLARY
jgi:hypothetical protein